MDIGFLFKIAGVGLIVTVFYQILKGLGREEQATYVSVAGIIVVIVLLLAEIIDLYESIQTMFGI